MHIATERNASSYQWQDSSNAYERPHIPWRSAVLIDAWRKIKDPIRCDNTKDDADRSQGHGRDSSGVEDVEAFRIAVCCSQLVCVCDIFVL